MPKRGHVEVAGAGLAGLAVAGVLARRGWSVRVHEKGDELREIGAGIFQWENALRVLEEIDAFAEATKRGERGERFELRDERMRLLQSAWMLPEGARLYTMLRTDLHKALAAAADRAGVDIVTSSCVEGATPEGELVLVDGRRLRADLVIGADGVYSRVRESLGLTSAVNPLRDGSSRHLVERRGEEPGLIAEYWNGTRRVGLVPCSPDHVYIYLCANNGDADGIAAPVRKESWIRSFPALEALLSRIHDDSRGRWAEFVDVVCTSWSFGRAAIVGDAAHALSPNLGQGAGMSLTNALALGRALDLEADVQTALRVWEREQRPVVDSTQRWSRLYGEIVVRWPRPLTDLRSLLVWLAARSDWVQERINKATQQDIDHLLTVPQTQASEAA